MKEDILKIINHYGVNHQLRKFNEETYELQEAIINAENNRLIGIIRKPCELAIEHIAEEIADVLHMLIQFILYYEIPEEDIRKALEYKVNRQSKRVDNEKTKKQQN